MTVDPEALFVANQHRLFRYFRRAVGQADNRDVFLMREVAGLGYEEIGRACALTPDAVRSRIHRARLQLRAQLAAPIETRRMIPMRQSGREP